MRSAWLLAVLLLLPLAGAHHSYSHRVYVVGRVVDSEGVPAPDVAVNVTFEGVAAGGACFDAKPERTNATGDYEVCRHVDAIPPEASVAIRVAGLTRTLALDADTRHASASFQLEEPTLAHDVNGERRFARTFTVVGRAFTLLPDPLDEEGVRVNATPIGERILVELRSGATLLARANASTNEHGLYRADLEVGELPDGALVVVRAGADVAEELTSPLFRRADMTLIRDLRLVNGPGDDAPGSAPTPLGVVTVLTGCALALSACGGARGRRRG